MTSVYWFLTSHCNNSKITINGHQNPTFDVFVVVVVFVAFCALMSKVRVKV